jgi:GT2 family glycosyltransferase
LRQGVTSLSNSRQAAIVTGPVISTTYPASEMHRLYLATQKNWIIKTVTSPFLYFIFDNKILNPGMMFESGAYSLGASLSTSQKIKSTDIDLATTTSMIIRRSILMKLKGFDERFTFNHADGDLFLRIKKLGFRIIFEPKMVVHHKVQIGPSRDPMIIGKDTALFYKLYLRPHSIKGYIGACLNIVTFIFYWVYASVRSRNLKQLEGIKGFLIVYFNRDE